MGCGDHLIFFPAFATEHYNQPCHLSHIVVTLIGSLALYNLEKNHLKIVLAVTDSSLAE